MLKRSLILIAFGAKALLLTVGLVSLPVTANADGDCGYCEPPSCYPDEPCWNEC